MSAPYTESLSRTGPHHLLDDLNTSSDGIRRSISGDPRSGRCGVVVSLSSQLASDEGYRLRFWAEAENSRRLTGPCMATVTEVSASTDPQPWVSYDSFPALPLTAASAADSSGGMRETVVGGLALALAEALLHVHSHGLVYAGLSPDSLLLTLSGPHMTGYGLVRAAAPDGTVKCAVPGVPHWSLPPEQRDGERPRSAGDVYALGTVLSYAATGRFAGSGELSTLSRLSEPLRSIVAECLARNPEERPRADTLVQRLRQVGAPSHVQLPEAVTAALSDQEARNPAPPRAAAPPVTDPAGGGDEAQYERTLWPARVSPPRRALLSSAVAGAAGLALSAGGVAGWRALGEDKPKQPRALSVTGTGPAPLWRYEPEGGELGKHTLAGSRIAVFTRATQLAGLDLRSGKEIWSRDDSGASVAPLYLGKDRVLISGLNEFQLLSARTGRIRWTEDKYGTQHPLVFQTVLGAHGNTIYFLATTGATQRYTVVAYRTSDRKELWRRGIAGDFADSFVSLDETPGPVVHEGMLLLPNTGLEADQEWFTYLALDLRTGRRLWTRSYRGVQPSSSGLRVPAPGGRLVAEVRNNLRSYDLKSGEMRWNLKTRGMIAPPSVLEGKTLYLSDSTLDLYAVDVRKGRRLWRKGGNAVPYAGASSDGMAISTSHRTLFRSGGMEIDAVRARDGVPLWRMAMVSSGTDPGESGVVVAGVAGTALLATRSVLYALPVD